MWMCVAVPRLENTGRGWALWPGTGLPLLVALTLQLSQHFSQEVLEPPSQKGSALHHRRSHPLDSVGKS